MIFNVLALFISIFARPCILKDLSEWDGIWNVILEQDVSPNTYYNLKNLTIHNNTDYKFDYKAMETLYRRYVVNMPTKPTWVYFDANYRKTLHDWFAMFICRGQNIMYQAAAAEIRKYFPLRLMYMDNLEFEVGYVVYQVIHRYQMLVELYEVAHRKYFLRQNVQAAASKYMLYVYRSMLKVSYAIIHLCNMAHEMERKFIGHDSLFVHTTPGAKIHGTGPKKGKTKTTVAAGNGEDSLADSMKIMDKLAQLEKLKKKAAKKERKRQLLEGMKKYEPRLVPKRPARYSRIYGWSIEDWWL